MGSSAWAYAALGIYLNELFEVLASAALKQQSGFTGQGLANLASAFAKATVKNDDLYTMLTDEVLRRKAQQFGEQELANVAWALATVRCGDSLVFASIASAAISCMDRFNAQELSNIAWAFATVGIHHHDLFRGFANAAARESLSAQLTPQGCSNLLWAYAKLGAEASAGRLFASLRRECSKEKLRQYSPHHLSTVAWSCATLALQDEALFEKLAINAARNIRDFSPQGLSNLAWAFTTLDVHTAAGDRLVEAMRKQLFANVRVFDVDQATGVALVAFAEDVISTLWALAQGAGSSELTDEQFDELLPVVKSMLFRVGRRLDVSQSTARMSPMAGHVEPRRPSPIDFVASAAEFSQKQPEQPEQQHEYEGEEEPRLSLDLHDRMVILKPPNWEVERNKAAEGTLCESWHCELGTHGLCTSARCFCACLLFSNLFAVFARVVFRGY